MLESVCKWEMIDVKMLASVRAALAISSRGSEEMHQDYILVGVHLSSGCRFDNDAIFSLHR